MWNRGKRSRSKSTVRCPRSAIRVETVDPAGPPPITITSGPLACASRLMSSGTPGGIGLRRGPEAGRHGGRDGDGLHGLVRPLADADDGQRPGGDAVGAAGQVAAVADGGPADLHHADQHLELLLEAEGLVELERGGEAGPA